MGARLAAIEREHGNETGGEGLAYALMFVAPAMFSGNMLVARATASAVPPVALAVGRWSIAFLLLLPFVAGVAWRKRAAIRREWLDLLVLGALGMGICGAVVYLGAATTTATNIGLIYAASPVVIILLARVFYGEAMSALQAAGVALSLLGVVVIIVRGDPEVLLRLEFTPGDLCIVATAISWAVYTVLLRHRPTALPPNTRFAATIAFGILVMLPFLPVERAAGWVTRFDAVTVGAMVFLAIIPGIAAYQGYALIQRRLGANRTSLLMYLIPVYNAVLAWLLLGERLHAYHFAGAALVLPGIYLATRSARP